MIILLQVYAERLRPIVCDTVEYVNKALQNKNTNIIVEGANATMLDIDLGGWIICDKIICIRIITCLRFVKYELWLCLS